MTLHLTSNLTKESSKFRETFGGVLRKTYELLHCIGIAMGPRGQWPAQFLTYLVIFCFEKRCPKQKYCCVHKIKYFAPPKFYGQPQNFGLAALYCFTELFLSSCCSNTLLAHTTRKNTTKLLCLSVYSYFCILQYCAATVP